MPQNRRKEVTTTSRTAHIILPRQPNLYITSVSSLVDEPRTRTSENIETPPSNMEDADGEDNDHLLLVTSMPGHTPASKRFCPADLGTKLNGDVQKLQQQSNDVELGFDDDAGTHNEEQIPLQQQQPASLSGPESAAAPNSTKQQREIARLQVDMEPTVLVSMCVCVCACIIYIYRHTHAHIVTLTHLYKK